MDNRWMQLSSSAGLITVCLSCFFIPLSTALQSIATAAMVLCWLLSGEAKKLPQLLRRHPVCVPPLLLLLMFVSGLFYSEGSWEERLEFLKKYRELLYFPIVFSMLLTAGQKFGAARAVTLAKNSFFAGTTTLLLISWGMFFAIIPAEKAGYSTLHHITHSFFMATLAFWALQYALRPRRALHRFLRGAAVMIFVLAVANLVFVTPGRTGMVTFVLLMVVLTVQHLTPKQSIVGLLILFCGVTGIYFSSDLVQQRTAQVVNEVRKYHPGRSRTSIGMRFDWWHNSIDAFRRAPVCGHGTGSFRVAQIAVRQAKTRHTDNPHNEYLLIAVQLGIVGEALFLLLLGALYRSSFRLPAENRNLLQGAVLSFAWACFANSFLLDSHPSHFLLILSAVLAASMQEKAG